MLTTVELALAAGIMTVLAIITGHVLGWADRFFHVPSDPKVEAVLAALPGANCGGCGYTGCQSYAEAIAKGEAQLTHCGPGGPTCASKLADILGIKLEESFPYRAVVHCSAHSDQRLQRRVYDGEPTCASANLVAGVQGCTYGCLGFGDCERACSYDACHVVDGLSTIDYDKCIGCRACARACPRNIISMVPFKAERMLVVACSNQDTAADVRSVCTVGCIGCKACVRAAPELITFEGGLPSINYDLYNPEESDALQAVLAKCPRKRYLFVGKPTEEDLAAVAAEELPESITADFKTTVDDTEWRG
jgi:RnfABCDGE-type electron transport complex B subunit